MERVIYRNDAEYPERFAKLGDAPDRLFVRGDIPAGDFVALVGSRRADAKMLKFTRNLAMDLARRGFIVVSGGALGIDTAAHEGALDGGGRTVVVLGAGLGRLYPAQNRGLFERIEERGALVTEYEAMVPPTHWTFPRRNRLVAAWAQAVVVIQAPSRSGSLITARLAREMGVPVGAVPCEPGNTLGAGCNRLIKNGAAMIESDSDVVRLAALDNYCHQLDLSVPVKQVMEPAATASVKLSAEERDIWTCLGSDPLHVDSITQRSGLAANVVNANLMTLALSGLIEDVGGMRFVKK